MHGLVFRFNRDALSHIEQRIDERLFIISISHTFFSLSGLIFLFIVVLVTKRDTLFVKEG